VYLQVTQSEKGQQGVVVPTGHTVRSKSYWQAHLRAEFHDGIAVNNHTLSLQ
jgi:hypothetical protein